MLTIMGNGMGEYNFSNIESDLKQFETIVCDRNFQEEGENIIKGSFQEVREYILSHYKEENILYVVTGSPLFFSAGTLIAKKLPANMVQIIDNTSSKSYMQERLCIADSEMEILSLHGRGHIDLSKFLTNLYTFILCDKLSIAKVQKAIAYLQPEDIEVTIGYKLGFEDEVIAPINLFDASYKRFDIEKEPYVLVIKRLFQPSKGLHQDSDFATQRGMITKRYKRQLSLQNLDLEANQLLWDIGAGSGSCGIEAYSRYKTRTIFFEKNEERVVHIQNNLRQHHVLDCTLLVGEAQEKFEQLEEQPSRIFVGGGGEEVIKKLPYLYERLAEDGVMLISAITLQHLSLMLTVLNEAGIAYEVISLSLTTYKGRLDLVEPERQLFQIKVKK